MLLTRLSGLVRSARRLLRRIQTTKTTSGRTPTSDLLSARSAPSGMDTFTRAFPNVIVFNVIVTVTDIFTSNNSV